MNKLRVAATTSTNISWRDEISYSHDVGSEGLEKLKEAIKQAKASSLIAESVPNGSKQQS